MQQVMDVVKKNMVSIICAVVILIAIAATFWPISGMFSGLQAKAQGRTGTYNQLKELATKERHLPVVALKGETTGARLDVFPTPAVIERGQKVKDDIAAEAKAMFTEAVKINRGDKKPLVPEALPQPPPGQKGTQALVNFQRAYTQEMDYTNADANVRNKSMPMRELRNKMGVVPTPEAIKAEQDRRAKIIKVNDLQVDEKGKPRNEAQVNKKIADVTAQVPGEMQRAVAENCNVYLDPGALTVIERMVPTGRPPLPPDVFSAQMNYWLQQDVLRAIAEANEGSPDVTRSAIKRIMKVGLPTQQQIFTTARSAAPAGGAGQPNPEDPNAQQTQAPADPTQPIPPNYAISPTGRYSNALYDVIQFKLSLVVDAARVPLVLQALSRNRFITVYNTNFTAVDAGQHLVAGYIYGAQPVVQLDLDCEALFLREWTKQYMPLVVRRYLGIPEETPQTPPAQ